jgi:uncharacterized protein YyaL (SSP411 family)
MSESYNRLIEEQSPYLLQHAANPVDWYPWGEEAFQRARLEDRPVFLSIGYSTCHWCHVMEHESFEDPGVAALLNESFVAIKVDREERPDIDAVYMTVCQMTTGHGGWPLTIVMTPDKQPFFAGTYFPRESRGGRIGMLELLPQLRDHWLHARQQVEGSAERIVTALSEQATRGAGGELDESALEAAFGQLAGNYDRLQGGFGKAPKFPTPHNLLFLLRYWQRTGRDEALVMVETTLRAMRRGGVFDQVGFGFHRYSTDARWLLPHFEKMLYDQALLAMAYTEAYQATGRAEHADVAREILTYVLRDMTDPTGGFYSAEDADSEGREGKFYVWSANQLEEVLGPEDAALAGAVYGVDRRGNFAEEATGQRTGENILHLPGPLPAIARRLDLNPAELQDRLRDMRQRLFEARETRVRPLRDDKILLDWNGLMIAALAKAASGLDDPAYLEAARQAADFVLANLRDEQDRLLRRYRGGEAALAATATDYAFLAWGLIELHQAAGDVRYLEVADRLMREMLDDFWDAESGGFFLAADRVSGDLPVRMKETYDGAMPASNSVAWHNLLRLARLTGDHVLEAKAAELERGLSAEVKRAPAGHSFWMLALEFRMGPVHEIVVAGAPGDDDTEAMLGAVRRAYLPNAVVLLKRTDVAVSGTDDVAPFTRPLTSLDGRATAYVCSDFSCERPTTSVDEMLALLGYSPV